MDPSYVSCPNLACPNKGVVGADTIRIHARATGRYRCRTCGRTFAATTNTPLYRLHHPEATLTLVLTLLLHGCQGRREGSVTGLMNRALPCTLAPT